MSAEHTRQHRALRGGITGLVVLILWFLPPPAGVGLKAWHLLALFAATIVGIILQPLPMGAVAIIGMTATALTTTLTPAEALTGFANGTVWLVFAAFLFSCGLTQTGLGQRIAYWFIWACGRRTLGLAYALLLSDLVLAPGTPSSAARCGGIIFPIVRSLAAAFHSEPGPTAGRIGRFLMLNSYHGGVIISSMFMTAGATGPLIAELARKTTGAELTWAGWALAALLPGLVSLLVMPLVLYALARPEVTATPEAAALAREQLVRMGRMPRAQWVVLGVFVLAVGLWVTGHLTHIDATVVALLGVGLMLAGGGITWQDVLAEKHGWDALIWFGAVVGMADMLARLGFFRWFSAFVAGHVKGWAWLPTLVVLLAIYLYSHYAFATQTAHVTAMFVPFLTVAVAAGAPPVLTALSLGYISHLNACLTHYGTGMSPIYYGAGYTDLRTWWGFGFLASLLHVAIWLGLGPFYWKALGMY